MQAHRVHRRGRAAVRRQPRPVTRRDRRAACGDVLAGDRRRRLVCPGSSARRDARRRARVGGTRAVGLARSRLRPRPALHAPRRPGAVLRAARPPPHAAARPPACSPPRSAPRPSPWRCLRPRWWARSPPHLAGLPSRRHRARAMLVSQPRLRQETRHRLRSHRRDRRREVPGRRTGGHADTAPARQTRPGTSTMPSPGYRPTPEPRARLPPDSPSILRPELLPRPRRLVSPGFRPTRPPARATTRQRRRLLAPAPRPAAAALDTVTVRRGDSLWSIAERHLGATATDAEVARAWPEWYAANRAVIGDDPDLIHPGMQLVPPREGDLR